MTARIPHPSRHRLAIASVLALAACDHRHHEDPEPPPVDPFFDIWEIEPNDFACCPDELGSFFVGDELVIGGHIRDDGFDPYDGFGMSNGEPLDVEFYLEPVGEWADLDLGVWDPWTGEFVLLWDSPEAVESGRFTVSSSLEDFHLVVMSFDGDAEYRLWLWFDAPTFVAPMAGEGGGEKKVRATPIPSYDGTLEEL
jgi:hypothetical protein